MPEVAIWTVTALTGSQASWLPSLPSAVLKAVTEEICLRNYPPVPACNFGISCTFTPLLAFVEVLH